MTFWPSLVNIEDDLPATKKAKPLRPMDTPDDLGMHTDIQVMDLDDASDPHEETLNKTNAIANIQAFFTSVKHQDANELQSLHVSGLSFLFHQLHSNA